MKANVLIFAVLCMVLCWTLPLHTKIIFVFTLPKANQDIPMGMVEDAVDDLYLGCNGTMTESIREKYFKEENTGAFAKVWKKARVCAEKNMNDRDEGLTKDHLQAICVYTAGRDFYPTFNKAVREDKPKYKKSFKFHSLHFWLTSAIQILQSNKGCHTTYRRTKDEFSGKVNQIIRFGFFASSSYKTTLTHFGTKTCFKIRTCSGAYLKEYPRLRDTEKEVLIPPYEKFKITEKTNGLRVEGLEDCKVVYILESAGIHSNLNCNAVC